MMYEPELVMMSEDRERDDHGRYSDQKDPLTIVESTVTRSDPYAPVTATEIADTLGWARRTALNKLNGLKERRILASKKVGGRARVWWLHPCVRVAFMNLQCGDTVSQQNLLDNAWEAIESSEKYETKRAFWQTALKPAISALGATPTADGRQWKLDF